MDASAATKQQQEELEEKAVEVENILVAKLGESIKRSTPPWSSRFSKCKELLKTKLEAESHPDRKFRARFRRKVHHLNILMAEHDSIIDYGNFLHLYRLSQVKKEIGSVLKSEVNNAPAPNRVIKDHTQRVPSRPSPVVVHGLDVDKMAAASVVVHGLDVDQMAAENLLLCRDSSPEFNAVGIYGADGVGKTTLALAVFHSEKVKSRYLPRIWICLMDRLKSETDDSDEIFVAKRILLHLGIDPDTIKEMNPPGSEIKEMKRAIRTELKGKRYLVVIDGVSEEMELGRMMSVMEMLRDALPKGVGGAVIVTGRPKKMVEKMVGDEEGIYQLQPLEEQGKCFEVFRAAAGEGEKSITDKDEKLKVKNEVVKRSHGLPWSSTLMGIIRREIFEKNKKGSQSTAATATASTDKDQKPEVENEVVKRCPELPCWSRLMGIIRRDISEMRPQSTTATTTAATTQG